MTTIINSSKMKNAVDPDLMDWFRSRLIGVMLFAQFCQSKC